MLPMPQRITEILFASQGVTLARTHDDYYAVGLDYLPGVLLMKWDPRTDYFASRNLDEARLKYYEYSGLTPRTTLPQRTEDNDRDNS